MTGIELMVAMMLQTCVPDFPQKAPMGKNGTLVETTLYSCPLLGEGAEFIVWRRICSKTESHAIAIRDQRTGRGFTHSQFGSTDPNYVEVFATPAYMPPCMTEPDLEEQAAK